MVVGNLIVRVPVWRDEKVGVSAHRVCLLAIDVAIHFAEQGVLSESRK